MVRIEKTPARRFRRKSMPKLDKENCASPMDVKSNSPGIKFTFNPSPKSIAMDEDPELDKIDVPGLNQMDSEEGMQHVPLTGDDLIEHKADIIDNADIKQSEVSDFDQKKCEVGIFTHSCMAAGDQSTGLFMPDGNDGSIEPSIFHDLDSMNGLRFNEESEQSLLESQLSSDVKTNPTVLPQLSATIGRLKSRIEKLGENPNYADKVKLLKKKLVWYENSYELRSRTDGGKDGAQSGMVSGKIDGNCPKDVVGITSDIPMGAVKMLVQKIENDKSMAPNLDSKGEKVHPKGMGITSELNEVNVLMEKDVGAGLNREDDVKAVVDDSEVKETVDQPSIENTGVLDAEKIDGLGVNEQKGIPNDFCFKSLKVSPLY